MKQIIVIFILTFFTLSSCNGQKPETDGITDELTLNKDYAEFNEPTITQEIDLFWLQDLEINTGIKVGFVSLSDIYTLSEHTDSLSIPSLENINNKEELQYFKLSTEYRERFLSKTNISETDSLFIYDYSKDVLLSFSVKTLNVSANLNAYSSVNDYGLTQHDYEIGFGMSKDLLSELINGWYYDILVFIGKENPFTRGQMKPIKWKKINSAEFPIAKSNFTPTQNTKKGITCFLYETNEYQYFIQDYSEQITDSYDNKKRHLMIIDKKSGNLIIERGLNDSEGSSVAPLNFGINNPNYPDLKEQWTGKLFKNKPEVVFGFEWVSFGCPSIIFLNSKMNNIYINCDNRH